MNKATAARPNLWLVIALVAVTMAVYWPTLKYDFVSFDDQDYVTDNPRVKGGLTVQNIKWAFTESHAANWHPITWISHMIDWRIFGARAGGHHLVNVVIHAANAGLLFLWLWGATGSRWRSATVAALFAWHPLHVESVAWISERKDVLSGMVFFLTLLAYSRYVSSKSRSWYAATLAAYASGLMAKSMLVTLPCLLLVLDFWPYRRVAGFTTEDGAGSARAGVKARPLSALIWEKVPFLVLSALSGAVTVWAQEHAIAGISQYGMWSRLGNATLSYALYLEHAFWPAKLAAIYPLFGVRGGAVAVAALILVTITIAVVRGTKRRPFLAAGWCWYLGMLVPVIGIVQVGSQAMADRYTYLPLTGVFVMLAWGFPALFEKYARSRTLLAAAACAGLAACLFLTSRQITVWQSTETLFAHAERVVPFNHLAMVALGNVELGKNNWAGAQAKYEQALAIYAKSAEALRGMGLVLARQNQHEAAIDFFRKALAAQDANLQARLSLTDSLVATGRAEDALEILRETAKIHPKSLAVTVGLGNALTIKGLYDEALGAYSVALKDRPDDVPALIGLAAVLVKKGDFAGAEAASRRAIQIKPEMVEAQFNLARALTGQQKYAEAAAAFDAAMKLQPDRVEIRAGLLFALLQLERYGEVIPQAEELLRKQPENPGAMSTLGLALLRTGKTAEAIRQLEASLKLSPNQEDTQYFAGVAWMRAGQIATALPHFQKAAALNPAKADNHYQLAVALAASGYAKPAIEGFEQAIKLEPAWLSPRNALAWVLSTHEDPQVRKGAEAVRLAEYAVVQSPAPNALYLNTLAAAQAETGQFESAVSSAQKALQLATAGGQALLAAQIQERLLLYQARQPFRDKSLSPPKQ